MKLRTFVGLTLLFPVISSADMTFVYPNPGGFTAITPGQGITSGYGNPRSGYTIINPGRSTDFIYPGGMSDYSITNPGYGSIYRYRNPYGH